MGSGKWEVGEGGRELRRSEVREIEEIPLARPDISTFDVETVSSALSSPHGRLSGGEWLERFEAALAEFVGARFAVGVSSGTAGLHLSLIAAGVGPGDFVLTTPFSFVASANCILYQRALPVFVDVEESTGNLDAGMLQAAIADLKQGALERWLPKRCGPIDPSGELKAILPVHVFGQPARMDGICAAAREYALPVIEDACESLGSSWEGRQTGTFGQAGVFAFYPNKQITTGEGGMIVTDDSEWAALLRSLRNQGRDTFEPGGLLQHSRLGFNYRLNELSAALGWAQMQRIEPLMRKRERVASQLLAGLSGIEEIELPSSPNPATRLSWFAFVIRLRPPLSQRRVVNALRERGIASRPYFPPIHLQPFYREWFGYQEGCFPVAENLGSRSLALPFFPAMTEAQIDRVCSAVRTIARQA